jgi:transposase-like protein
MMSDKSSPPFTSALTDDLARFCCQNTDCLKYGVRGASNLTVCGHYGKQHRRLLYCRTCKYRFSERKGTPLFNTRLSDDKALDVLAHLADGCGVRQTGRLAGVDKDTAARYAARAGGHARQLHDELVGLSPPHGKGPGR